MRGGLPVRVLDCQSRGLRIKSGSNPGQGRICLEISATPAPHSRLMLDEYTDRTLSVGRLKARERTSRPPSYTEAKKIKALRLHIRLRTYYKYSVGLVLLWWTYVAYYYLYQTLPLSSVSMTAESPHPSVFWAKYLFIGRCIYFNGVYTVHVHNNRHGPTYGKIGTIG